MKVEVLTPFATITVRVGGEGGDRVVLPIDLHGYVLKSPDRGTLAYSELLDAGLIRSGIAGDGSGEHVAVLDGDLLAHTRELRSALSAVRGEVR